MPRQYDSHPLIDRGAVFCQMFKSRRTFTSVRQLYIALGDSRDKRLAAWRRALAGVYPGYEGGSMPHPPRRRPDLATGPAIWTDLAQARVNADPSYLTEFRRLLRLEHANMMRPATSPEDYISRVSGASAAVWAISVAAQQAGMPDVAEAIRTARIPNAGLLPVHVDTFVKFKARVIRRGANWRVVSDIENVHEHTEGQTHWRYERPRGYSRAENTTHVRAVYCVVQPTVLTAIINRTWLRVVLPEGFTWKVVSPRTLYIKSPSGSFEVSLLWFEGFAKNARIGQQEFTQYVLAAAKNSSPAVEA